MSETSNNGIPPTKESSESQTAIAVIGISLALLVTGLIVIAVLLAINADNAGPGVEIIRDFLIIIIAFELIISGTALTVLLIQIARFVNLLTNEVQPMVDSLKDTVQTVQGTATFVSKYLAEPVSQVGGTLGGINKVLKEIDAIRTVAGAAATGAVVTDSGPSAETASTKNQGVQPEATNVQGSPPAPDEHKAKENQDKIDSD